jgi:hypothetical protein
MARATALALLPEYLSPASLPAVEAALGDTDPLARATALAALETLPPAARVRLATPRLRDAVRAVRLAAAHALAGAPQSAWSTEQQADFDRALAELIASEMVNAERPEAHLNLATLYARLGRSADAEAALKIGAPGTARIHTVRVRLRRGPPQYGQSIAGDHGA